MKTIIEWHKTTDGLPEPTKKVVVNQKTKKEMEFLFEDECLVIFNGKVKPSRYLSEQNRWEGHLKDQIPEYWVKIKEIETKEVAE